MGVNLCAGGAIFRNFGAPFHGAPRQSHATVAMLRLYHERTFLIGSSESLAILSKLDIVLAN